MDAVDDFLEHYGTKGMKWGVRKEEKDRGLIEKNRVRLSGSISTLASAGMKTKSAATIYELNNRFKQSVSGKHAVKAQDIFEANNYAGASIRMAVSYAQSQVVKNLVMSAVAVTSIATSIGFVAHSTAKAYFTPLNMVYSDMKPVINKDLRDLRKSIKTNNRSLTVKQYEAKVANIVSNHMTTNANKALFPFYALAQSQLGLKGNPKNLKISFEKLPNTDVVSKMIIETPAGLKLVKSVNTIDHAESNGILAPNLELYFDYKFDSEGYIVEWSCPTIEIADDLIEGRFDMAEVTKKFDPELNLQHVESVDDFLEHYGTKGMKWGVRRQLKKMPSSQRASYLKGRDAKWLEKVEKNPKLSKVSRLTTRYAKRQTKLLKKDYKERGLNIKKSALARSRYDNEVKVILDQALEKATYKAHKLSPSRLNEVQVQRHPDGTMTAKVVARNNAKITKQFKGINRSDERRTRQNARAATKAANAELKQSDLMHIEAPTDEEINGLEFFLVLDAEGFVDDILSAFDDEGDTDLEQSDFTEEFLKHYGTKGMRWGVRRASRPRPSFMPPVKVGKLKTVGRKVLKPGDKDYDNPNVPGVRAVPKGSGPPQMKPKWQSPPPKKTATPTIPAPKVARTSRFAKKKTPKVLSEEAQQFRDLRVKAKKEGVQALTNKDLELINKRIELQSKYNKAFPKKKNPFVEVAIDGILSDYGSKKIVDLVKKKNPMMGLAVEAAIELNKKANSSKKTK